MHRPAQALVLLALLHGASLLYLGLHGRNALQTDFVRRFAPELAISRSAERMCANDCDDQYATIVSGDRSALQIAYYALAKTGWAYVASHVLGNALVTALVAQHGPVVLTTAVFVIEGMESVYGHGYPPFAECARRARRARPRSRALSGPLPARARPPAAERPTNGSPRSSLRAGAGGTRRSSTRCATRSAAYWSRRC